MKSIDSRSFEYALSKIDDGFVFERFAQDLLSLVLGVGFRPVGGVRDKGIDGLEHCLRPDGIRHSIYQISIDANSEHKIHASIDKLIANEIPCDRFYYVTNRVVRDQARIDYEVYERHGVPLQIYDAAWLRGRVNSDGACIRLYHTFIESYLHEFVSRPDEDIAVTDFATDPRVFVYLRQQWEEDRGKSRLDEALTDSLILLALEGTDPDRDLLRSRDEIRERILGLVATASKTVDPLLDARLEVLSTKPRRINHHRDLDSYCLPYETRLEIESKNLEDRALHEEFVASASSRLERNLEGTGVTVREYSPLLIGALKKCFQQQGLEFADFVLKSDPTASFEKSLPDIISNVVDESAVVPKNKEHVKAALLTTVRDIVYQGAESELRYLQKLSDTYMMLFLLQSDPGVATYFSTLAGKLRLFVCNSILVPALSEYPLDLRHRRHWMLLKSASAAGVSLYVDRVTIEELEGHLRRVTQLYYDQYHDQRDVYIGGEAIGYVDEIMIRSYLYSVSRGADRSFDDFIDTFASPYSESMGDDSVHESTVEYNAQGQFERLGYSKKRRCVAWTSMMPASVQGVRHRPSSRRGSVRPSSG
jgi:hypothetical protein